MPSTGGGGKAPLYEKIRDIPDASGTSISIDVSDIDWTKWRKIRIFGCITCASSSGAYYFRVNNLSTSIYVYSQMSSGADYSFASADMGYLLGISASTLNDFFDIEITQSTNQRYHFNGIVSSNNAFRTMNFVSKCTVTSLSTFNISHDSFTITFTKGALWGMKL